MRALSMGVRGAGTRARPDGGEVVVHDASGEWITAGRRPVDEWLADGVSLLTAWKRRLIPCSAAGCERSRSCGWWCSFHCEALDPGGAPGPGDFAQTAPPAPVGEARCEVPGCRFPAMRRTGRLCDSHKRTAGWCRYKGMCDDVDSFLVLLAEAELRLVPHYDFSELGEPLRSELRFVIQQRLDENRHALDYRRVASAAEFVAGLGVELAAGSRSGVVGGAAADRAAAMAPRRRSRSFATRADLARLRDRAYGVDPYSGDVWLIEALGIPEFAYQPDRRSRSSRSTRRGFVRWRSGGRGGGCVPGCRARARCRPWPTLKKFSDFLPCAASR